MIPLSFNDAVKNYEKRKYYTKNMMHFINLDSSSSFGNLQLIFIGILQDIEQSNKRIYESHYLYVMAKNGNDQSVDIGDHLKPVEESIYWMKRAIDRLIALHWLIDYNKRVGKYPAKIKVDSIGELLRLEKSTHEAKKSFYDMYEEWLTFLNFMNRSSNAYKHSVLTDENPSLQVGQKEPLVISLGMFNNDSSNNKSYQHDSLDNVTVQFTTFYRGIREILEKLSS